MRMAILHEGPGPASKPKSEYKEVRIPLQIKLMKSDVPSKNEKHRHFLTFIEQESSSAKSGSDSNYMFCK